MARLAVDHGARTPRPKVAGSSASFSKLACLSTSAETCAVEIVVSVRGIESATSVTLEEKLMEACETSFLDQKDNLTNRSAQSKLHAVHVLITALSPFPVRFPTSGSDRGPEKL